MRKFQGNRVRKDDVIRVLERHGVRHLFRSSHLEVHDFEHYVQRNYILEWEFNLCHLRNVSFTFYLFSR